MQIDSILFFSSKSNFLSSLSPPSNSEFISLDPTFPTSLLVWGYSRRNSIQDRATGSYTEKTAELRLMKWMRWDEITIILYSRFAGYIAFPTWKILFGRTQRTTNNVRATTLIGISPDPFGVFQKKVVGVLETLEAIGELSSKVGSSAAWVHRYERGAWVCFLSFFHENSILPVWRRGWPHTAPLKTSLKIEGKNCSLR